MTAAVISALAGFGAGVIVTKKSTSSQSLKQEEQTRKSQQATVQNLKSQLDEYERRVQNLTAELAAARRKVSSTDDNAFELEDENASLKRKNTKLQAEVERLNSLCQEYQKACEAKDFEIKTLKNR